MQTIISVQDEYVATINTAWNRWSHRKNSVNPKIPGGHYPRISRGAYNKAEAALTKLGLNPEQIKMAIKDAKDMAELERNAEVE